MGVRDRTKMRTLARRDAVQRQDTRSAVPLSSDEQRPDSLHRRHLRRCRPDALHVHLQAWTTRSERLSLELLHQMPERSI